ncbi:MAG TPA: glycosyltransferase family 25 protein [Rubrivivax sp.]|nr:glycosyltransferase family 25 protein [Rubrivivax sp.]HPO18010.1 glycosyltransferase family 25 protein [Rubrivivax sp.]
MPLPVYLINLPHHAERKAHADAQLRRCGLLDAVVFSGGVYGRELSAGEVERLYDARANARRFPKQLTPGEIGCYASHLGCWQAIAAAGAPMALVIEDDVCLDADLAELARDIGAAGIGFDMIKLIGRPRESVLRRVARIGSRELIDYLRPPSWTGAYLVSREGAAKLAQARARFFRAVDVDLRFWWEVDAAFRLYGLVPYPAQHAHFASVLGTRPPSPYGVLRRRWLQLSSKLGYELNVLLRAAAKLARGRRR